MVKLNKIYTRTGDEGSTGLVDGSRVAKDAPRMAAIGDIDELNSALGVAEVNLSHKAAKRVRAIQNDLFDLGADIATPGDDFTPNEMSLRIVSGQVERLEQELDVMNAELSALTSFILPGGKSDGGAALHLARAICRRAERTLVAAARDVPLNPQALKYINRLSDYLFVMARWVNDKGNGDILWVPGASREG